MPRVGGLRHRYVWRDTAQRLDPRERLLSRHQPPRLGSACGSRPLPVPARNVVEAEIVTANPTAEWTARQITEAFPYDTAPRYMIRDRDGVYGDVFRGRVKAMDIEEVLIAPRSPWQSP